MYTYTHIHIRAQEHTAAYAHTNAYMYTHIYIHAQEHTAAYAHMFTHTHPHTRTGTHTAAAARTSTPSMINSLLLLSATTRCPSAIQVWSTNVTFSLEACVCTQACGVTCAYCAYEHEVLYKRAHSSAPPPITYDVWFALEKFFWKSVCT